MKYTCSKCNKVFGKKYNMLRHIRTVCYSTTTVSPPSLSSKCNKVFSRNDALQRHETTCVVSPPLPKRAKREDTTPRHPFISEDPINPPDRFPFPDALSTDLLEVVRNNWSSIRTRVSRGPLQTRVNYRLTSLDTSDLKEPLNIMFDQQSNAFKINLSYGFVLKNKNTGCYRYYHSSCNCCGRYLDEPSLITDRGDFDEFLERIKQNDILQWALSQRPDSQWICELVTNVTFFINKIINHPIGCVAMTPLPTYIKKNKAVIDLEREPNNDRRYNDNLSLFRCLALHRGSDRYHLESAVTKLYETYKQDDDVPMEEFAGVTLEYLYRIETTFQTNVCVYKLVESDDDDDGKKTAELVRRSLCHHSDTMYLNLHETHFSYIQNIQMYCHSYKCRKCGESLFKGTWQLIRHERTCTGVVRRIYPGGVYHSTPSVFERLDDENIRVPESLRYYPYRATFDFECYFDAKQLPSDSNKVHWVARHVPLSVSVASNVPGHEQVQCLVTDGDTIKLVSAMTDILQSMSDAA